MNSVRYRVRRGGFPLPRLGSYTGRGAIFTVTTVPSPLILWMGSVSCHHISWEPVSGFGEVGGRGMKYQKNTPQPAPFSGVGQGTGPGAHYLQGLRGPITNTTNELANFPMFKQLSIPLLETLPAFYLRIYLWQNHQPLSKC